MGAGLAAPHAHRTQLQPCNLQAHNLADAVNHAHSALLTLPQARAAHSQLAAYLQRYGPQMNPGGPMPVGLGCICDV